MKLFFAGLILLLWVSVSAQQKIRFVSDNIAGIRYNTGRVANALEKQNSQSSADSQRTDLRLHKEWFYNEIQAAVPDYRFLMAENEFKQFMRTRGSSVFDPITVITQRTKVNGKRRYVSSYRKNNPDSAIKTLLDYKEYKKENEKLSENMKAAANSNADAAMELGRYYENKRRKNDALSWFIVAQTYGSEEAADAGDNLRKDMHILAKKDAEEKAEEWLKKHPVPTGCPIKSDGHDKILSSSGFKNWLQGKPVYLRIVERNKDSQTISEIIEEYKTYAGIK